MGHLDTLEWLEWFQVGTSMRREGWKEIICSVNSSGKADWVSVKINDRKTRKNNG